MDIFKPTVGIRQASRPCVVRCSCASTQPETASNEYKYVPLSDALLLCIVPDHQSQTTVALYARRSAKPHARYQEITFSFLGVNDLEGLTGSSTPHIVLVQIS